MTVISKFTYSAIAKALKKRYYTRLNGASYYQIAPVTLSGDFYLKLTGTFSSSGFYLFANTTSTDLLDRVGITSSRVLFGFGNSTIATLSIEDFNLLTDGNIHTIKVVRIGSQCYIYIDDSETYAVSGSCSIGDVIFDSFGHPYAGSTTVPFFVGYMFDVDINNVRYYPLDEPYNVNGIYRDEINADVPLYDFSNVGTRVLDTVSKTETGYAFDGTGQARDGGQRSYINLPNLTVGDSYLIIFSYTSAYPTTQSASWFLRDLANGAGNVLLSGSVATETTVVIQFAATTANMSLLLDSGADESIYNISDIVFNKSTAARLINGTSDDVTQELA